MFIQNFPNIAATPEQLLFWAMIVIFISAATATITWLFSRPKNRSEIDKMNAETDKVKFETFTAQMEKFHDLLQRIGDAKLKSIEMEQSIAALNFQKSVNETEINSLMTRLDECTKSKSVCTEVLNSLIVFFSRVENALDGMPEHIELMREIRIFKARMENGGA